MSERPIERYLFDNAWQQERERLAAIERSFDPGTIREIEATGISKGWQCLEVGAGGGSIAEWLSDRVGKRGRVIATDIDTRFLAAIRKPNLEALQHNIVTGDLPQNAFDLII